MSTEASPKGKGGRAPAHANNDADSIMPLLFATIGNPAISFKKMAAMDELGRTESSLEHKFRKWRQKGREIAAEHPENAGTLGTASTGATTTKKPRAPAKKAANGKGKGPVKQSDVEDEEVEIDEEPGAVKQEPDEMGDIGGEMLPHPTKGKATTSNGTKKRASPEKVAAAEHEGGQAPAKKAKVVKKGTAKVVKKSNAKAYTDSEDEDAVSESEEKVPTKPKGKAKGNVAAANGKGKAAVRPTGPAKAKKGKAARAGQIPIHEDEDADVDMDDGDGQVDGLIDMQFDEAA